MALITTSAAGLIAGGPVTAETEGVRMRIRALRNFYHEGALLAAGQPYEIPEAAARRLIELRRAEAAPADEIAAPESADADPTPPESVDVAPARARVPRTEG